MSVAGAVPTLLETRNLVKHFRLPGGWLTGERKVVHAVDDVTIEVRRGEVLGVVGESGSGKTTLGRLILCLEEPTEGSIVFEGRELTSIGRQDLRRLRRDMQVVFQNPFASLSPRMKILDVVAEPLRTHRTVDRGDVRGRVLQLLEQVGLGAQHMDRYPHELSGGQAQRVAIARALALEPKLLVLDEPTSALDVSVQAQILGVLEDLREQRGLTYVFISHDLSVVRHISDRIAVMYLGKVVEMGSAEQVFEDPLHPYTRALLEALPTPDFSRTHELRVLEGAVPSATDPPSGCRFHERCPLAQPVCSEREPVLRTVRGDRLVACHLVEED
jgi:oligopeptide/dipeptide ABC transporter ATP-binding protein